MKQWLMISIAAPLLAFSANAAAEDPLARVHRSSYWAQWIPQIHLAINCQQIDEVSRLIKDDIRNLEILHRDLSPLMSALHSASFAHGCPGRAIYEQMAIMLWKAGANINTVITKQDHNVSLLEYASNGGYSVYLEYIVDFFNRNNIPLEGENLKYYKTHHPNYTQAENEQVGDDQ